MQPEYIFETSWEVCQKIGGIYAVLSTRAAIMQKEHKDKVFFIGPDLSHDNQYFKETKSLLADWKKQAEKEGLKVRVGRWLVPGKPIAVLVDFTPFWHLKDSIYYHNWERFSVNSIAAYGDYDESSIFGYATGVVMESIYRFYHMEGKPVVAHFNEWMTSFGLFYVKEHLPQVGTLFTTHATSIGRSIAGNNKPLYDYFLGYQGDQMAQELNMVSKHSTEKQAALHADCFTTVSEITDRECKQLLTKPADVVTPNGFESEFVPKTESALQAKRDVAKQRLRAVAEKVLGYPLSNDAMFIATGGRYEFKNKGIDMFLSSLRRLQDLNPQREVVAFLMIPAWISGVHPVLGQTDNITTHQLVEPHADPILNTLHYLGMNNRQQDKVKVIFIPSYLRGDDGVLNLSYYDLLTGMDLTVFPSYYEPWGYTPLESIAFHVPTITTTLAGFGLWALSCRDACDVALDCVRPLTERLTSASERLTSVNKSSFTQEPTLDLTFDSVKEKTELQSGVAVIRRTDSNFDEAADNIASAIAQYATLTPAEQHLARLAAATLAEKAEWKHFFNNYRLAYNFALK